MKGLLQVSWVQASLAWLVAAWMGFCLATMRLKVENREAAEAVWDAGGGVIVCFWHAKIALSPAAWDFQRGQEPRALISQSSDGEVIARAIGRLGIPAIRGSSTKKNHRGRLKEKGGTEAFRELLRWVKAGNCIAVTPDGPRGPARQMAEGPILIARLTRAPVLMMGLAARPAIRLNTWDRGLIPLPFARGAIVWGDAVVETGEDSQEARDRWAARLSALEDRAEALLA
ncbi:MAG: lysophospholipid acyltransferase family protein [Caulobacteraceae bacterium]|nr:lysophospholipid acyltransferase family protein [Caulobacteraceae bacterium]